MGCLLHTIRPGPGYLQPRYMFLTRIKPTTPQSMGRCSTHRAKSARAANSSFMSQLHSTHPPLLFVLENLDLKYIGLWNFWSCSIFDMFYVCPFCLSSQTGSPKMQECMQNPFIQISIHWDLTLCQAEFLWSSESRGRDQQVNKSL